MGTVRMTEHHRVTGIYEPFESIYEYTYCDRCGSFNVGYPSKPFDKALAVTVAVSYVAAIGVVLAANNCKASCLIGLIGLIAFLVIALRSHLRCMKCGNEQITSDNVLGYSKDDKSVIDVPIDSIIKHHVKTTSM